MKKNILLVMLSLLIALGMAEIALRAVRLDKVKFPELPRTGWVKVPENIVVEHHPVLGWYSQKNRTAIMESQNFPKVEVHTNFAGFRGAREYLLEKPQGMIRIAALGDSFAFGFGVQDGETFPALLELQDKTREVLNLGVSGYGIDQIYLSYREIARKYQPDVVLIGIFQEDFWRCTRSFADTGHVKPYFSLSSQQKLVLHNVPVPPPYSLNTNQFPPLLEESPLERMLDKSVLYRLAKKPLIKLAKNLRLIDPNSTEEWLIGRAILKELIREVRRDGATPVLVLMPPQDWARTARKTTLERSIIRFAERENVHLINLHPVFTEAVGKDGLEAYYIKNDWHWTPRGHALAAKAIEDYFKRKEL